MILKAENIEKSFYQGSNKIPVLKGLNLEIQAGETVAILGRSGSGKSTLLSLLAGLDHPSGGSLSLMDQNIFKMSEDELANFRAKNMGIVFQNYHLMPHLNASENVALPMEILNLQGAEKRAQELLETVGLSHRGDHTPDQLSGGENQRVAVARALSASPAIILADEPSGSLDEDTGAKVTDLLFDLIAKENRAMVLVTHDLELAERCSKKYRLENGRLNVLN
jgi:putative ABC transport system ATP-binding protein